MSYFARKLRYAATDGESCASYMALVELAKKKGGRPAGFILYRRIIDYGYPKESKSEMIHLKAETVEEAIKRFWPFGRKGSGKEFPGHNSDCWEKTTLWLNFLAAGGGHEGLGYEHNTKGIRFGSWAKVGTPAPWSRRRKKKKPLQFGNLAHIMLVHQAKIRGFKEERRHLNERLSELSLYDAEYDEIYPPQKGEIGYEEYTQIDKEVEGIDEEIMSLNAAIENIRAEMRYKVYRMFPKPAAA
ncbi:MAG: hypothetical protein WBL19_01195 [Minisyncoccia bacterium]